VPSASVTHLSECVLRLSTTRWIVRARGEPPAGQDLDNTEDIRCTSTNVLVVSASNSSWTHRDALTGSVAKRDGPFVEANDRFPRIVRPGVEPQHIFHPGNELIIDCRDAPHFFPATA